VRFADGFEGMREISLISIPGFADGEPLAATVDAIASVHAEIVRGAARDVPFALVGYSSGGLVAHALATCLEGSGDAPVAVVLIDTQHPSRGIPGKYSSMAHRRALDSIGQLTEAGEDAWITAMAHYSALDWSALRTTEIPTLLVRATNPVHGMPDNPVNGPREEPGTPEGELWPFSSHLAVVDAPGDHFTIMEEHAYTTGQAVSEWLDNL
jgi:thioesterase domain-containing protein